MLTLIIIIIVVIIITDDHNHDTLHAQQPLEGWWR